MANLRSRAIVGERVILKIQYYNSVGLATDPDSTPEIRIRNSRGEVVVKRTSNGVTREDVGLDTPLDISVVFPAIFEYFFK